MNSTELHLPSSQRRRTSIPFVALLALSLLVSACGRKAATGAGASAGPMEVAVITLQPTPVTLTEDLPGRTSAFRIAEVRARVSGIVQKRLFEEGSDVTEGQVLYEIDPAPYQAALDVAAGNLARAEASASQSAIQVERVRTLLGAQAVSQQDYDNALAAHKAGEAEVAAARAALQSAQINLGYTRVVAPLSGRIGRSEVTEGAYVQQGAATLLATIQQLDPIYVDLTQSSTDALRLQRALQSGRVQGVAAGEARVRLLLDDGTTYGGEGRMQFSDVTVSPSTGSIRVRAVFPNPDRLLLPGMFVRARVEEARLEDAILVPQPAVSRSPRGEGTVFVVGPDNKVQVRTLTTARTIGQDWLVETGLNAGDRVVVDRLQRLRPGMEVRPVAAAAAAPAGPVVPPAAGK